MLTTGTGVATERELRVERHRQLVGNLDVGLHIEVRAAHTRTEDDTLVLTLGKRDVELHLLRTTTNVHVGRVVQRCLTHHLVLPVVRRQRTIHVEVVGVTEVRTEELTVAVTCTGSRVPLVLVLGKLLGVHQVELLGYVADVEVAVEAHLHIASLGVLRGDHHNAVTTLGTVDGGQGGILQNINRCDVRGRNIVDVVHLETVHDIEGLVGLCNRRTATHTDVNIGTRLTVDRRHLHTGNLTLQGHSCRGHGHHSQLCTADGTHRTGQVLTGLAGVTDDHHLFQGSIVVL